MSVETYPVVERGKPIFFLMLLVLLIASTGYFSIDFYLPSLPAITKVFSVSTNLSQLTVTMFLISFCISQLLYGPFSDHYGRKPTLLGSPNIYGDLFHSCLETLIK